MKLNKQYISFIEDVDLMIQYIDVIELSNDTGQSKIALSAALQGRIMTGISRNIGWINRELIASTETLEHMNPYSGEERFWLGPGGGQFSIFFKTGSEFNLENCYAPKLIDQDPYVIHSRSLTEVVFTRKASLVNYSGFNFEIGIERKVSLLEIETHL